jgi:cobalt-zinc-cadmium efflux system outer membrane protein
VEAGKLSPAEKSRARIQLYQEKLTLRDIETSLKSALRLLSSFWGEEHSSFTEVEGNLTEIPSIPTLKSLDTAPTIRLSKLVVEIQQANIKLEKANGVPDIELGGGVKQSDLPGNTYQFGLSIPLPIFNRNQGNIGSAKSELKKARFELKEVEIQVQTILFRLKTELEVLASEIDILKNDIIPEAQAAYTTISEGYLNGRFTYLDVVDTQRMWFESREQYIGALKNYHINILELDRIMGNTYGKETH